MIYGHLHTLEGSTTVLYEGILIYLYIPSSSSDSFVALQFPQIYNLE